MFNTFRFDNPASVSPTPARQLTYNYLLPINFWLLLFPSDLCCDWTMGTIRVLQSIVDPRNLVTMAFYLCLAKIVHFALLKQGKLNRAVIMVMKYCRFIISSFGLRTKNDWFSLWLISLQWYNYIMPVKSMVNKFITLIFSDRVWTSSL